MARDARAAAVAQRAVELAAQHRVRLGDDLALWPLAGGRPTPRPDAAAGALDDLGRLAELAADPVSRQRNGVHFTPPSTASALVAAALDGLARPSVCDPCCGGGAILLAAARHLAGQGEAPAAIVQRLWGTDVDPLAVATTEVTLALWAGAAPPAGNLQVADALLAPPAWPPFDAVVGNPPFLSQLGRATARDAALRHQVRARFGAAAQAYTDAAALFLLAACDATRPGGVVALLQPQSVLGARDAAAVRDAVMARGRLRTVWVPDVQEFDARVAVCAPIIEVGAPGAEAPVSWTAPLAAALGVPPVDLSGDRRLGDVATCAAGFRDEFYGLAEHVHEHDDRPGGSPVVTAGLVDLGTCAWGARPARIGGRRWRAPVVDRAELTGRAAAWASRTAGPKVVVATQTPVIEAVVDGTGAWVPGVPLIAVLPRGSVPLWDLAAALCAPPVSAWVAARTAGTGLSRRALRMSAGLARQVPLPDDRSAWRSGADALERGDLDTFARALTTAYGSSDEVLDWWRRRARLDEKSWQ